MLVKHNVWDANYHFGDNFIDNFKDGFDYVIKDNVIIAKLKESINSGLLIILHEEVMKPGSEGSIQCIVENLGDAPFDLQQLGLDNSRTVETIYPNTKQFINYSGVYREAGVSRQLRIFSNHHEEMRFKIYGLKIIEGKSNDYIYLPNIDTLSQDKKPLLPPEGEYKEIQPR